MLNAAVQVAMPVEPGVLTHHPGGDDSLNTVGLALLAYGLVQLLSKIIDKISSGKFGGGERGTSFTDEDRRKIERVNELLTSLDQRMLRVTEAASTQQKLVGQALDELRESTRRHESLARKLNAVRSRVGSRTDDKRTGS